MADSPELQYFKSVYQGFLDFQSGKAQKRPTKPAEQDEGAIQIYRRALRAAAEEIVRVENGGAPLTDYRNWFNAVDPATGSKWMETHKPKGPANAEKPWLTSGHAWLDTNQDGEVYREGGYFSNSGDGAIIQDEYRESYYKGASAAMAVNRVYSHLDLGPTPARTTDAKMTLEADKVALVARAAKTNRQTWDSGFSHYYGGAATRTLNTAMGETTELPKLEDSYVRKLYAQHEAQAQFSESVLKLELHVKDATANKKVDAAEKATITSDLDQVLAKLDTGHNFNAEQRQHLNDTLKVLKPYVDATLKERVEKLEGHGLGANIGSSGKDKTR